MDNSEKINSSDIKRHITSLEDALPRIRRQQEEAEEAGLSLSHCHDLQIEVLEQLSRLLIDSNFEYESRRNLEDIYERQLQSRRAVSDLTESYEQERQTRTREIEDQYEAYKKARRAEEGER